MEDVRLSRSQKMGLLGAISYIIGNIVGSGIFITPSTILKTTGSMGLSLIIWVTAACISMLGSFCYVELGTSIRMSGGDFAYLCFMKWYGCKQNYRYPIAFAFMCIGCTINYPATLAVQAQTFAEYMFQGIGIQLDPSSEFWSKKLVGFALMWLLLFLNFFSLKTFVSRFQIAASIAKVVATGLVIVTGFYLLIFKSDTQNLHDPFMNSKWNIGAIVSALFACLFSYDGWDILNFGAEEIEKPKRLYFRTMPLAIVIGMACIALIYVAVNFSFFVVLTPAQILSTDAVAMTFAHEALHKASFIMPIFVAVLLIGSLNSTMFSASRYLQAAAKQGHLPAFISGINPTTDSPRTALTVHVRCFLQKPREVEMWMCNSFELVDFDCYGDVFRRRSGQPDTIRVFRTVVSTSMHNGRSDLDSLQVHIEK
ncbi:amino acid permease [Necator americanus]|uniref:Amino acid permease n=1 Tax=Necator americanus TaxID=51031 RepID=W2SYT7_NECAM|nr:amino acid permease [Necator americanus]ETN74743.1 amino acid permease [Necator americanus]